MNLSRNVWLPPDGDVRLVRLQQEMAAGMAGGAPMPPHLALRTRRPHGGVATGAWALQGEETVLEAWDGELLGFFHFGLVGLDPLSLAPPPRWSWTRGLTAVLELQFDDLSFVTWTWRSRRGWKASPPTE